MLVADSLSPHHSRHRLHVNLSTRHATRCQHDSPTECWQPTVSLHTTPVTGSPSICQQDTRHAVNTTARQSAGSRQSLSTPLPSPAPRQSVNKTHDTLSTRQSDRVLAADSLSPHHSRHRLHVNLSTRHATRCQHDSPTECWQPTVSLHITPVTGSPSICQQDTRHAVNTTVRQSAGSRQSLSTPLPSPAPRQSGNKTHDTLSTRQPDRVLAADSLSPHHSRHRLHVNLSTRHATRCQHDSPTECWQPTVSFHATPVTGSTSICQQDTRHAVNTTARQRAGSRKSHSTPLPSPAPRQSVNKTRDTLSTRQSDRVLAADSLSPHHSRHRLPVNLATRHTTRCQHDSPTECWQPTVSFHATPVTGSTSICQQDTRHAVSTTARQSAGSRQSLSTPLPPPAPRQSVSTTLCQHDTLSTRHSVNTTRDNLSTGHNT